MADKKISDLTAATTPLAGTEVVAIVQSGTTKKAAVSDLTAGRAISATQVTLSTGNLIVGTSGQGIDFSATPGTGTSELLDDYEEGTYTATLTPATGSITVDANYNQMAYTKIGQLVHIQGNLRVSAVSSPTGVVGLNLPFTSADLTSFAGRSVGVAAFENFGLVDAPLILNVNENATGAFFSSQSGGTRVTNLGSNFTSSPQTILFISTTYVAA